MPHRLARVPLYLALPALVALNAWAFPALFGLGYFEWFLYDGPLIAAATGFLALVWEDLETRDGLLALDPAQYLGTCFVLAGVLVFSAGTALTGRPAAGASAAGASAAGHLWDTLALAALGPLIAVFALGWVLVVAPLNWVVTLVAGAPARLHLRGVRTRAVVYETASRTEIAEEPVVEGPAGAPSAGRDVSLGRHPFAVTQALVALVTYAASFVF